MADTSVNPDNRARRYVRLQNRRQFTTEFKIEAVRLIEDSGRTSVDVALLRRWRQIYGRDGNVIDS